MMDLILLGFLLGVFLSIPAGPLGLLTIRRTIKKGFKYGFISGLGIVLADAIFVFISLSGIEYLNYFLHRHREFLEILLGIGFLLVGGYIFVSKFEVKKYGAKRDLWKNFLTTFSLAFLNIGNLLYFGGVYGYFFDGNINFNDKVLLVVLFILGGLFVHFVVHTIFIKLNLDMQKAVLFNKIIGVLIMVLSLGIISKSLGII